MSVDCSECDTRLITLSAGPEIFKLPPTGQFIDTFGEAETEIVTWQFIQHCQQAGFWHGVPSLLLISDVVHDWFVDNMAKKLEKTLGIVRFQPTPPQHGLVYPEEKILSYSKLTKFQVAR